MRCNPLSATGRANILLDGVLNSVDEPLCPASSFFDVVVDDVPLNAVPLPCASAAQIGTAERGPRASGRGRTRRDGYRRRSRKLRRRGRTGENDGRSVRRR